MPRLLISSDASHACAWHWHSTSLLRPTTSLASVVARQLFSESAGYQPCLTCSWLLLCLTPLGHPTLGCGLRPCTVFSQWAIVTCLIRRLAGVCITAPNHTERLPGLGCELSCGFGPCRAQLWVWPMHVPFDAACGSPPHHAHRVIRAPRVAHNGCQSRHYPSGGRHSPCSKEYRVPHGGGS